MRRFIFMLSILQIMLSGALILVSIKESGIIALMYLAIAVLNLYSGCKDLRVRN